MKILGTGLDGLVGSRIVELLKDKYEFDLSEVDITDRDKITEKIKSSNAPIVLHLAAKTDVDGCERDKEEDQELLNRHSGLSRISQYVNGTDSGVVAAPQNDEEWDGKKTAWAVNVYGTKNVADSCKKNHKKLIYISTDFVFDGENTPNGGYTEEDAPNPINWYAKTKYEGEKIVQNLKIPWIISRIASPYRANFVRFDFFRAILKRLQEGQTVAAVSDHVFTPTFIDDIAFALDMLIYNNSQGIFHVVGSQSLSPFEGATLIADEFKLDKSKISKTTRSEFFNNRAPRAFQLALKNDKIGKLGVRMRTFEEGLREIKSQNAKVKIAS